MPSTSPPRFSVSPHLPGCRETSERLSEFLDDELDEDERHQVALHLALCESCAQLAVGLAATIHALHGLRSDSQPRSDPARP